MPSAKKKNPLDRYVGLRIHADDLDVLDKIAKQHGKKRGTMIRFAVQEYLSKEKPLAS